MTDPLPEHYSKATRVVLRYVVIATVFGLLSGVLFQESSKKLPESATRDGIGLESTLSLALVHGHVLVAAVLVPLAMLGAAFMARAAGGRELTARTLKALTRGYLPFVSATILLMLYRGYHVLLSVRGGETDFVAIDSAYFGGVAALRHGIYAVAHIGMFVSLTWFVVGVWRSLKRPAG